jgi:hypothetical protein
VVGTCVVVNRLNHDVVVHSHIKVPSAELTKLFAGMRIWRKKNEDSRHS